MQVDVVIPCFKVTQSILKVLEQIPEIVTHVICVDDACPDNTADLIEDQCSDNRVIVLRHSKNRGVGGAVMSGYQYALTRGADIVVKLDGDGQMSPIDIEQLIQPILDSRADYTKGNRFYVLSNLDGMPLSRLIGNAALSFLSKLSTGYWRVFDPTNGFTAIHTNILREIPLEQIHQRYFFESDLLYQLSTLRALVVDVPQRAHYGDETSQLNVSQSIPLFFWLHSRNFFRRLFYNYFLRDFHLASIQWLIGPTLLLFGVLFGASTWFDSVNQGVETPIGTVMVATLPIILGLQLLLSAIGFDIDNQPRTAVHPQLSFKKDEHGSGDNSVDQYSQ